MTQNTIYNRIFSFSFLILSFPLSVSAGTTPDWQVDDISYSIAMRDVFKEIQDGQRYAVPLGIRLPVRHTWPGGYAYGSVFFGELHNATLTADHFLGASGYHDTDYDFYEQNGKYFAVIYDVSDALTSEEYNRIKDWFETGSPGSRPPTRWGIIYFEVGPREVKECCSSVLFLPGFKGSELYVDDDRVWPPDPLSNDIEQMRFGADGLSAEHVVVGDIVESAYGVDVYGNFAGFMDDLVATGTIKEWRPFSYDWRHVPSRFLNNPVLKRGNEQVKLLTVIQDMAEVSDTGKVTIVGHSMGGLLGKALVKYMDELGLEHLIDSLVTVGTPQLGTPQAIPALLHGEGEEILFGIIMNKAKVRAVANTMPGAHTMIPAYDYYGYPLEASVIFDAMSPLLASWRGYWGISIGSFIPLLNFLRGSGPDRVRPDMYDLQKPEVLQSSLVTTGTSFPYELNRYTLPGNVRGVQIAGWGLPTLKAIKYVEDDGELDYRPLFTIEGDDTVVYPSALYASTSERYYVNLDKYNDLKPNRQHRDFLSAEPVQNILLNVFHNVQLIPLDNFVSLLKPVVPPDMSHLILSVHSPMDVSVTDSRGNFTGVNPNQETDADIYLIKNDIPNSSYRHHGEGKYLIVPSDGQYSFSFTGTGTGFANIELEQQQGESQTLIMDFKDVSVVEGMKASLVISSWVSSSTALIVDIEGDGVADKRIFEDGRIEDVSDWRQSLLEFRNLVNSDVKNKLAKGTLLVLATTIEKAGSKSVKYKVMEGIVNAGIKLIKISPTKSVLGSTLVNSLVTLLEEIKKSYLNEIT